MRAALTVTAFALVVGCKGPIDHYPANPGGNTPPIGGGADQPDAPVLGGDGGTQIAGRVCLTSDLRNLAACSATAAGGLTVTLGSSITTTLVNGAFAIDAPLGSAPVWHVSGVGIVTSVVPFSAASTDLPAIGADVYTDLLIANGVLIADQQGTVVASIVRAGAAMTDALVDASPTTPNPTFYDGNSATLWDQDATGPKGLAWLPGADVAVPLQLTVTPPLEGPAPEV
jgi:hypothetical protein